MKSRLSYFLISGIIILSISSGIFIWNNQHQNKIHKFNEKTYNAPVSSKYIPRNTDLVFHWKVNPKILPNYIEDYQNKRSKASINKQSKIFRDSFFKLISLDFERDISQWVGDYGSFAIFNSQKKNLDNWILVLGIKDNVSLEKELESFLGSSIYDQENKSSSSRTEIISKRLNSNNSIYFAKEEDNLLISSNPKIIQSSIEQLDNNILNTKEKYKNIQLKDNLNDGLLLLEISPKKILDSIGQEKNLFELNEIENLISSINLDNNKLSLEGILSYNIKTKMPVKDIPNNASDIHEFIKPYQDFILIDSPKQYFRKNSNHPYQRFIASLIQESTSQDYSHLFKIILENSQGNLIWINDKDWLVLTKKSETSKSKISEILTKEKFLSSNLDFKNRDLEVWSKISTGENENNEIRENIEAIIEEDEETYIWSQSISSISNFDNTNYFQNHSDKKQSIDKVNDFDDILRIHLGKEKTKTVLNNFYPYVLFKTMLGNKLNPPQNIDISIAVPTINYPDFIKFKINLKTS